MPSNQIPVLLCRNRATGFVEIIGNAREIEQAICCLAQQMATTPEYVYQQLVNEIDVDGLLCVYRLRRSP